MYGEILGLVEKPVRYIGQEWNQVAKPAAPGLQRVAFAFPDAYEIGMSHLGLRILYDVLNRQPDIAAERVFCPAVDMEAQLRRFRLPLATLETRTPLARCDVVGFSLQFEMEYTNVLTMLDLGGIPLRASERGVEQPLVVAGGPCALSPEPMADFIDVFVIGDGEEAFPALVRRWAALRGEEGRSREQMLAEIARLEGMYVPSLYGTRIDPETGLGVVVGPRPGFEVPFPVRRAVVRDLERYPFPAETIVPYGEVVHDRVSIEIARGCTEGCRFCQAGIIYRPVRERSPAEIIRSAVRGLESTGYDEVSLTSLSTADYSCVSSLVEAMMDRFERDRTAMSVSSMRVYGLTRSIAEQLARVRRTGFTIAPEAGTQRLRDLINKGVTDGDIETAARIAWSQGWTQLKMYFILGLPTETDADVLGIARTGIRVWELARELRRPGAKVTVSASGLVPKPHSTFQWEPIVPADELRRRQRLVLDAVRPYRNVKFKYHNVEGGVVECLLARGDRRLGRVIESAWRRGARFDAWSDHFDFERWMDCLREAGLDANLFLRRIPVHAPLPWDHIDTRVTKEFLVEDLHRGMQARFSPACEKPFIPRDPSQPVKPLEHARLVCYDCGLDCDLEAIAQERSAQRDSLLPGGAALEAALRGEQPAGGGSQRGRDLSPEVHLPSAPGPVRPRLRLFYRLEYSKRGDLRWLSHLDLVRALQRGFKRAGIVLSYSQGFHPAPLMSFGPALAVGIESACELLDFEIATPLDPAPVLQQLNESLPAGLRVLRLQPLPPGTGSLSQRINLAEYRAWINAERRALLPDEFAGLDLERFHSEAAQRCWAEALLGRDRVQVRRQVKGRDRELDIRPFIRALGWLAQEREVQLWLRLGPQGQARPQEVLENLYGVPGTCFRIRRQALFMESASSPASALEPALV